MTTHSRVGGSGASRWMKCPGSVALADGRPDEPEEFAAAGTVAHEICAIALQKGKELWTFTGEQYQVGEHVIDVDPEMVGHCQLYVDTVLDALPQGTDVQLMIERKVSLADLGYPEAFGTLDAGFVEPGADGDTLHIFDLKYGEGIFVEASSVQFKYYAAAAICTFPELCANLVRVKVWVIQPRIDWQGPKVRTITMPLAALQTWVSDELLPAIDAVNEGGENAPLVPSKETCRFCPAQAACPAQAKIFDTAVAVIQTMPDPVEVVRGLSNEELGRKLELVETVRKYVRMLEAEAFQRMQKGSRVPGQKLVETKTSRIGRPGFEAEAVRKWGNQAYAPLAVKSIAQLEKLPGGKEFATKWGHKPAGAPTLAPVSDNRPEIQGTRSPEKAFSAVLTKIREAE